jgi:hypothetical protein
MFAIVHANSFLGGIGVMRRVQRGVRFTVARKRLIGLEYLPDVARRVATDGRVAGQRSAPWRRASSSSAT